MSVCSTCNTAKICIWFGMRLGDPSCCTETDCLIILTEMKSFTVTSDIWVSKKVYANSWIPTLFLCHLSLKIVESRIIFSAILLKSLGTRLGVWMIGVSRKWWTILWIIGIAVNGCISLCSNCIIPVVSYYSLISPPFYCSYFPLQCEVCILSYIMYKTFITDVFIL